VSPPSHGTLTGTAPNLTYTPASGFLGYDEFTYTASDGSLSGNIASIVVDVTAPNHPPVAMPYTLNVDAGQPIGFILPADDSDADDLTYSITSYPTHGTLTGEGNSYIYTPVDGFEGNDSLTFSVNDGHATSAVATVTFSVAESDSDYDPDIPIPVNFRGQYGPAEQTRSDGFDPQYTIFTVSWDSASFVDGYEIQRAEWDNKQNDTYKTVHTAGAGETSWTDENLVANKIYMYRIMAFRNVVRHQETRKIYSAASSVIRYEVPFLKGILVKSRSTGIANPAFQEFQPSKSPKWYLTLTTAGSSSSQGYTASSTESVTVHPLDSPRTYSGQSSVRNVDDEGDGDTDTFVASATENSSGQWNGTAEVIDDDDDDDGVPAYAITTPPYLGPTGSLASTTATAKTFSGPDGSGSLTLSQEYPSSKFIDDVIAKLPDYTDYLGVYGWGSEMAFRRLDSNGGYFAVQQATYKFDTYPSAAYVMKWFEVFQPDDRKKPATFKSQSWNVSSPKEFLLPSNPKSQTQNGAYLLAIPEVVDYNVGTRIFEGGIAWIDPSPRMPRLVAHINGLSSDFKIKWKLVSLNGDHTKNGGNMDRVELPLGGGEKTVPGDQEWYIFDDYTFPSEYYEGLEIPDNFFGGDVTVSYTIVNQDGSNGPSGAISFRIGGQNPDDLVAKDYIKNLPEAKAGQFTYAWAMAQEESAGEGKTKSFFNQFSEGSADLHGIVGAPYYNASEGSGWGMIQRDDSGGAGALKVDKDQIWNWQANIKAGIKELSQKYKIAVSAIKTETNLPPPAFSRVTEPDDTPGPDWGQSLPGLHCVTMTAYNGTVWGGFDVTTLSFVANRNPQWIFKANYARGREKVTYFDKVMEFYSKDPNP
jgi:hypothetical protein